MTFVATAERDPEDQVAAFAPFATRVAQEGRLPSIPLSVDPFALRRYLEQLAAEHPQIFSRLFSGDVSLSIPCDDLSILNPCGKSTGILQAGGLGRVCSKFRVWQHNGALIVTDFPSRDNYWRAYPYPHEVLPLLDHLEETQGRRVLDLCTGTGILAVYAAKYANEVTAIDLNSRAIKLASLNAKINRANNVKFLRGDLFNSFRSAPLQAFDVIFADPPFVPTPPGLRRYLHSDGGITGLRTVIELLEQSRFFLNPGGVLHILSYSLGTSGTPILMDQAERIFRNRAWQITPAWVSAPFWLTFDPTWTENPIASYKILSRFAGSLTYEAWLEDLYRQGLTHLHMITLSLARL